MAENLKGTRVGIACYTEAEWQKLRAVAADRDALEETYAEWKHVDETGRRDLTAAGIVTEPVQVSVDELLAWCREHRCPLDGSARAAFASELLRRRYAEKRLW
jgi:hypothetical protein